MSEESLADRRVSAVGTYLLGKTFGDILIEKTGNFVHFSNKVVFSVNLRTVGQVFRVPCTFVVTFHDNSDDITGSYICTGV